MSDTQIDFTSGSWRCIYWFPSNEHVGDDPSEYRMKAQLAGDDVVFESLPTEDGSYMLVRLHIEDGVAVGTWHETTSPIKAFRGAQYSGSGQLVVNPVTGNMEGKWVGAGLDQKLGELRIYNGNWEITREQEDSDR